MRTQFNRNFAFVAASLLVLCAAQAWGADPAEKTKSLVAVLQSDASLFEKARACQQLGELGTPDAVPDLARLLTDPKLSAYARSGLEGIPDRRAAAALRDAARQMNGPLLAGVVNSIAARRDAEALPILTQLAVNPTSGVVKEALLALGNIATPEAIRVVETALTKGPEGSRGDAAAACLLAADRQRTNDPGRAAALYDLVRNPQVPLAYRVAGTRGAILARQTDRPSFLLEQLLSNEPTIRNAALLTVREVPDETMATTLNLQVQRAKPELQQLLLLALADCHNSQSIAVVQALTRSPQPEVRKTALTALGRLGSGAAAALLDVVQQERPADEKSLALSGLKALEGSDVDNLLLQNLSSAGTPGSRADLIGLVESRGVRQAAPELMKQAGSPDKEVRLAALSALRGLAGANEVPGLIDYTRSSTDDEVREAAENALAGACNRSGDSATEAVEYALKRAANAAEKSSWVRVLGRAGHAKALPSLKAAASDADPAVAASAIMELGRWPDPAPMPTLLKLLQSHSSPELRKHAFNSVVDLSATATDDAQAPAATIVSWLEQAQPLGQSTPDKRRILGVLGRLKAAESLRLLVAYLDDPSVQPEAASGVIQIAPALAKGAEAGALKVALDKITSSAANPELRERASQLAKTVTGPSAPVSLFDGTSLAGWDGDTNVWRVRDGVILGGSMNGNPRNEFLASVRRYTNFILRLEYKLVGTEGFVNSGVQFRSERVVNPPNEMSGYQADIGAGYSGGLYDESRRNKLLVRGPEEIVKRAETPGDWNRYEIRCEGPHIQLFLNGEKTVDYTEPEAAIPQKGLLGLQIHGGNKAEVSFRSITVQEL